MPKLEPLTVMIVAPDVAWFAGKTDEIGESYDKVWVSVPTSLDTVADMVIP
jgi:hypothetical protein